MSGNELVREASKALIQELLRHEPVQYKLAKALGVTPAYISQLASGGRTVSLQICRKIAQSELFRGNNYVQALCLVIQYKKVDLGSPGPQGRRDKSGGGGGG